MRTSLNEIKAIEDFLFKQYAPEGQLVFDARLIVNQELRDNTAVQKQVYKLVRLYGRKKFRAEIEAVHHKLFHKKEHRSFRNTILSIFN